MLDGLYSAAAGMAAQQARLDALSNDVANVDTVGYKRVRVAFHDLVYNAAGRGSAQQVATGAGAAAVSVGRGDTGASQQTTDRPLDVMLGEGTWLQVRRPDGGPALTRDGGLEVGADGQLRSGGNVLDPSIRLPQDVDQSKVEIAGDGDVSVDGKLAGRLPVVTVASPDRLAAAGSNLFVTTAASGAATRVARPQVQQGVLETSDVDLSDVMADMMDAQRSYQMASKAISMQDQMMQIANGIKR